MPLPSSVQSIALRFTKGDPPTQLSHTQSIPLESMQVGTNAINSVKIDSTFMSAFNAESAGTIFTPSIVINHGNNITSATSPAPSVPNFVPRPPPPLISLAANGVTIQYTPAVGYTPPSFPFVQANPRGTGTEWFAVVNDSAKPYIAGYAKNQLTGINYFTRQGQSDPVPFNNIVTTLMTDMSEMFYNANAFNSPIASWDTSKVTSMDAMFAYAYAFNQPIGLWDTSIVEHMNSMFENASVFNQNISSWTPVAAEAWRNSVNNFRRNSPLSNENTPPNIIARGQ